MCIRFIVIGSYPVSTLAANMGSDFAGVSDDKLENCAAYMNDKYLFCGW